MKLAVTIATGVAIGLGAWALRNILLVPGNRGPITRSLPLDPLKSNPQNAAQHKRARGIADAVLPSILGHAPSVGEIQYGQAVGWLESNYGRGWVSCKCKTVQCDMAGAAASNNWGAVQSRGGVPSFQWCDTNPDDSEYAQHFRSYPTPEAGAADMLAHIFKSRKSVADALSDSGATVFRASLAMRRTTYYGGRCPGAIKAHGAGANKYGDPKGDPKALACEAEAVTAHAKRMKGIIDDIAAACGDAGALPLGTLEDAISWFDARRKAA